MAEITCGPQDTPRLSALLTDGASIVLTAGRYELDEPLRADGTCAIHGDGDVVLAGRSNPIISVPAGADLTLSGLVVERDDAGDLIGLEGALDGEHLTLRGATEADGVGGAGARVSGSGQLTLRSCTVTDCQYACVRAAGDAALDLSTCALEGGRLGLGVTGSAVLVADTCRISGTQNSVYAGEQARGELKTCTMSGGDSTVCLDGEATLSFAGGRIEAPSAAGIYVVGAARLDARELTVDAGAGCGVLLMATARARFEGGRVENADGCGVLVRGDAALEGLGWTIEASAQVGLHADGRSSATLTGCTLMGCYQGMQAAEQAQVQVSATEIVDSKDVGVVARNGGRLTMTGGAVLRNTGGGIALRDDATGVLAGVRVHKNGHAGVGAWERATLGIGGCRVEASGGRGILMDNEATGNVEDNLCVGNGGHGIVFLADASGAARRNRGHGNASAGIYTVGTQGSGPNARPHGQEPPPPDQQLGELLGRLEAAIEALRPAHVAALKPGIAATDLAKCEATLGRPLPHAARAWFEWHDGQTADSYMGLWHGFEPLSLDEALAVMADNDALAASGDFGPAEDWWCAGWLPILGRNGPCDVICIDLDGAFGGYAGQIVEFWHDDPDRAVAAPTLAHWVELMVRSLEAGCWANDDGDTDLVDEDTHATLKAEIMPGYPIPTCARYPLTVELEDNHLDGGA